MFKRINNFIIYRKIIENNKMDLEFKFNIKIDRIYRMGSYIAVPKNKIDLLRSYKPPELEIHKLLDDEVKSYIARLDRYFIEKGLFELAGLYFAERTDDNAASIIISFKQFDTVKVANRSRFLSILSFIGMGAGFFNPLFVIPGASLFVLISLFNFILFKKLFI